MARRRLLLGMTFGALAIAGTCLWRCRPSGPRATHPTRKLVSPIDDRATANLVPPAPVGETREAARVTAPDRDIAIRGHVRSETGRLPMPDPIFGSRVSLYLYVRGSPRVGWADVRWEEGPDGQLEGSFELTNLARRPYRLTPPYHGNLDVEPSEVVVEAPADDVEFLIRDAAGWSDLSLEAVDDDTGAVIENRKVDFESDRSWRSAVDPSPSSPFHRDGTFALYWPHDHPLLWRVSAPGYLSAEGELVDLLPVRGADRPRRHGRVRLKRGTEIVFTCRAQAEGRRPPLADVSVYLDGILAGSSSARGEAFTRFAGNPRTVRFVKPGWKLVSAPRIDLATGALPDPPDGEYYVVFEPTEK